MGIGIDPDHNQNLRREFVERLMRLAARFITPWSYCVNKPIIHTAAPRKEEYQIRALPQGSIGVFDPLPRSEFSSLTGKASRHKGKKLLVEGCHEKGPF
jgi:hypothetical protein